MTQEQYRIQNCLKKCPAADIGETGENMQTLVKSDVKKFNKKNCSEVSAIWKYIETSLL